MTARRDLVALEEEGRVKRTHGGAILPEYAGHEDSFWYRLDEAVEAKERLADAAVGLLEPGESVFLDCSTTTYYLARRLLSEGPRVTVLTNSVPVMELLMKHEAPKTDLVGVGGIMRKLTLSFVGPHAVRTISAHSADRAFLSVKGVTGEGFLTDPDVLEAEVKRVMIEHCEESVLLADGGKFRSEAPKTDVVGVGGSMRKLTLSFVGPHAVRTISAHSADRAFLSVKGVTGEGFLTDPDVLEAEVKRVMIEHCEESVLLADGGKF